MSLDMLALWRLFRFTGSDQKRHGVHGNFVTRDFMLEIAVIDCTKHMSSIKTYDPRNPLLVIS